MFQTWLNLTVGAMPKFSVDWFLHDPTGKLVGAGLAVVASLFALWVLLGMFQWARAHLKALMACALLVGAGLWGLQYVTDISMTAWAFCAAAAFGGFLGYALWKTRN